MSDNLPSAAQVCAGRIVDPGFRGVRLYGRRHAAYHGPIHAWGGRFWILYDNAPVRVWCHIGAGGRWTETEPPADPPVIHIGEVDLP